MTAIFINLTETEEIEGHIDFKLEEEEGNSLLYRTPLLSKPGPTGKEEVTI